MSSDAVNLAAWARGGVPDSDARDVLFATLADRLRRETVSILLDERESLSVTELATRVAERTVRTDERKRVYLALVHNHLPALETAGFVVYDSDDDSKTVEASGELLSYRHTVETVLSTVDDRSSGAAAEELAALANRQRRAVIVALDGSSKLSFEELATRVVDREREVDVEHVENLGTTVRTALHHVHLPKLDELDLVRYDPETKTVERGENDFADRLNDVAFPSAKR